MHWLLGRYSFCCCCYVYFIFIEKQKKICSMVMCYGEHIGVKSHPNIEKIILYLKKEIPISKTIMIY